MALAMAGPDLLRQMWIDWVRDAGMLGAMKLPAPSPALFHRATVLLAALAISTPAALAERGVLEAFRETEHWRAVAEVAAVPDENALTFSGEGDIIVNGERQDRSIPYLMTQEEFGDVHVEFEFMVSQRSNSGVYLMGRYEIQIFDSFGRERAGWGDLGGLYARWDAENDRHLEGRYPIVNAAKPPGEWQTMEILFRAPTFDEDGNKLTHATFEKVVINGEVVQRNAITTGPTRAHPLDGEAATGPVAIQGSHGPVAIRNFRATPLPCAEATRLEELDAFWDLLSNSVGSGDFDTFRTTCHPDAVLISGRRGRSEPLANALVRWERDFENTRDGRVAADASFRWAARYGDTSTAFETGILRFVSQPAGEEPNQELIHFEAVLVKGDDGWQILTEYQKGLATQEEWDALDRD